jgi:high-affinity nickel-transport protein
MEASGLLLMLTLGLRHGFDPDHIAIIDGVSTRYINTKPALAKWTGTLFAIGHGTVVTIIVVMIGRFSHAFTFSTAVWNVLDWLPGILLILVGILNLRNLQGSKHYHPKGWKFFFLPKRLKESSHPLAIVFIGMLFAMLFDMNTHVAAWAYSATAQLSVVNALLLGASFSVGMVITATLDSRILFALMRRSVVNNSVLNYRKSLGWIGVSVSFIVGGYQIGSRLLPSIQLADTVLTYIGAAFFVLMVFFYLFILYSTSPPKKAVYGDQRLDPGKKASVPV